MNQQQPSSENDPLVDNVHDSAIDDLAPVADRRSSRWLLLSKPKLGISIAILLVLTMIPPAIRHWRISSLPPIDQPFDIEAFKSQTIPDEENAFVECRQAFELLVDDIPTPEGWDTIGDLTRGESGNLTRGNWKEAPVEFARWLEANEESLALWLAGTRKPRARSWLNNDRFQGRVHYLRKARTVAKLAVMNADYQLHENDTDAAWSFLHAAFRFSRHLGQDGLPVERLTGNAIFPAVSAGILSWAHHQDTNAAELDHAIHVLRKDYEELTALSSVTLKNQYIVVRKQMPEVRAGVGLFAVNPQLDTLSMFLHGEPDFSESAMAHIFNNFLSNVDSDLATRPPIIHGVYSLFDVSTSSTHTIGGKELSKALQIPPAIYRVVNISRLDQFLASRELERTFHATTLAALAIESFVRTHLRFPKSLEECAAGHSKELFADPNQPGYRPLYFDADDNYAVVYSIGTDGLDDGHIPGQPAKGCEFSWGRLNAFGRGTFEGYRIPLWKPMPDMKVDKGASVESDNVQG